MQRALRPFVWIRVADALALESCCAQHPFLCLGRLGAGVAAISPLPLGCAAWAWWHMPLIHTQEAEKRRFVRPAWSATE